VESVVAGLFLNFFKALFQLGQSLGVVQLIHQVAYFASVSCQGAEPKPCPLQGGRVRFSSNPQ
jgi:hypothetical protein